MENQRTKENYFEIYSEIQSRILLNEKFRSPFGTVHFRFTSKMRTLDETPVVDVGVVVAILRSKCLPID